jgi:hypothetical protein
MKSECKCGLVLFILQLLGVGEKCGELDEKSQEVLTTVDIGIRARIIRKGKGRRGKGSMDVL